MKNLLLDKAIRYYKKFKSSYYSNHYFKLMLKSIHLLLFLNKDDICYELMRKNIVLKQIYKNYLEALIYIRYGLL